MGLPSDGLSGGLLLLWDASELTLLSSTVHRYSITAVFRFNAVCFTVSTVYGPTNSVLHPAFISELHDTMNTFGVGPAYVLGDFNITRWYSDRNLSDGNLGGRKLFNEWIDDWGLLDIQISNHKYTWSSMRDNPSLSRLDRILVNIEWADLFPNQMLLGLPKPTSDHVPLGLDLGGFKSHPPFRFERAWLGYLDFDSKVGNWWSSSNISELNSAKGLAFKLRTIKENIKRWRCDTFGSIRSKKDNIMMEIQSLDLKEEVAPLLPLERDCKIKSFPTHRDVDVEANG